MESSINDLWTGLRPEDLKSELRGLRCAWWICGGRAIDLWLGHQTRHHADTDIGCFRPDLAQRCEDLSDWRIFCARRGLLTQLEANAVVPTTVTSLWCRRSGSPTWDIQVMIEEGDTSSWYFRRDLGIRRSRDELTWRTKGGVAVLRPEVQLLYKAKDVRPHDQADFDAVLPTLDSSSREWLSDALEEVHPEHPWLECLAAGPFT